jgi:hypothetical protein
MVVDLTLKALEFVTVVGKAQEAIIFEPFRIITINLTN